MNDVIDAVSSRIKSPYFGYSVLAFFALNWRGIFLLVTTPGSPEERLIVFDGVTSTLSLIIYPLVVGALAAGSTHWVRYLFSLVSKRPLEWLVDLHLEAENRKIVRQTELEKLRSKLFAAKEDELIERAQRDEKVAGIEDADAKEKLMSQLESLRLERDQLSSQLNNQKTVEYRSLNNLSEEAREILVAASRNKNGAITKPKTMGNRSVQAGGVVFGAQTPREYAKYEQALDDLVTLKLVKETGASGELFYLTHAAWQVLDTQ